MLLSWDDIFLTARQILHYLDQNLPFSGKIADIRYKSDINLPIHLRTSDPRCKSGDGCGLYQKSGNCRHLTSKLYFLTVLKRLKGNHPLIHRLSKCFLVLSKPHSIIICHYELLQATIYRDDVNATPARDHRTTLEETTQAVRIENKYRKGTN